MIRLDSLIAKSFGLTRSEASRRIRSGGVAVQGQTVRDPSAKVDETDEIALDGETAVFSRFVCLMLNKPRGFVCATRDGRDRTVLELVPGRFRTRDLFPAGRLDRDSTGFCLITDDGALAHRMLAPSSHVPKTYEVTVDRELPADALDAIGRGMTLDGRALKDVRVEKTGDLAYRVILHEGVYHEIKRIFAAFGATVLTLRRVAIGSLSLDPDLAEGDCRVIDGDEIGLIFADKAN